MDKRRSSKIFAILQKIGTSLMLPVSVLPAAGILLRFGQDDLLGRYGYAFQSLAIAGNAIFNNLPMIFAVGVAIGFSGGKSIAALSAVIGELILQSIINDIETTTNTFINMGVFGGIVIGLISATLYNKYHNIKLPKSLGFFGGKRFIPIITSIVALIFSIIAVSAWIPIQEGIDYFAKIASKSILGPAFYAAGKRLLIPVGLHHMYYPPFLFQFGEFVSNGVKYFGDSARYFHGDPTAGVFMAAEYPILMFGLPGAAFAMILASKKQNRKKISGIMISAALVAFMTGITEPIEFSFIFASPLLFIFHILAAFTSGIVTSLLQIRLGYTFSASAIDYILGFKYAQHPLLVIGVGVAFFMLYFFSFYFIITIRNIKTPGRDDDIEYEFINECTKDSEYKDKAMKVVEFLGGNENIKFIDACITRLRLILKDASKMNKKELKKLGAAGILKAGNNVQIIFGTEAERLKDDIDSIIDKKNACGAIYDNKSTINIYATDDVEVISLEDVPDEVFKEKILGDGFAIKPKENKIYSPVDGKVTILFPTKHAITISSNEGLDILIHVGIDTINLKGEGFIAHVDKGEKVKKGDLLISFDKEFIKSKAKSLITPVIVTNMEKIFKINVKYGTKVKGELVSEIIKK